MKKFLLSIFAVLFAFAGVQAGEYTYTFSAKQFTANGTKTLGNVDWTLAGDGGFWGYDGTKGQQFGSGNKPYKTLTLSTSGISGTITKIVVNTSGASSINASFTVSVGGTQYGSSTKLTTSATAYTFTGTASGDIELSYTQTSSKAIYIKSISVTYEAGEEIPTPPDAPVLPEEQTFRGSMQVAITGIGDGVTVYYTTDGTEPSESNGTEYTAPFEITATTTVKAVALNEAGASEVVTKIYTVVEETEGYYIKVVSEPTDWSGKYLVVYEDGADAYVFNGEDIVNGYVLATTDGDVIKANSEVDAVAVTVAAMEGGYSVNTAGGYIYGVEGSNALKFGVADQANTIAFVVGEGVEIISNTSVLRFNSASNQKRFRYYKSDTYEGQQPVQLYKYVEALPLYNELKVTDAGYATLCLGFNARIPSTVEAYTVTKVNDGWVSLTQVTGVIPSQTGIIVKAAAGDYKFFYEETATADVADNLLEGTLVNQNIDEEAYVLGKVDGVVGLYLAEMTDGTWLNNANKAYLPVSAVPNASATFYGFDWEGTTGIDEITDNREQSTAIYDLTGRRVEAITAPGIYVVNGKKILVK